MRTDKEKAYMAVLALVVIFATFYLGNVLLTKDVPTENRDIVNVALGMIFGLSSTVVGYYFGSSKSSSDKTEILGKIEIEEENTTDLRRRNIRTIDDE